MDSALCQATDDLSRIIQVASQSIYGVTDDRVALANVFDELLKLRVMRVLGRGLVHEALVERNAFESDGVSLDQES